MAQVAWIAAVGGLLAIVYVLLGYPLLMALWAALRPYPETRDAALAQPSFSIFLVCYNEEKVLPAKLDSLANLAYPPDLVEYLLADDGSSDGTRALLEAFCQRPDIAGRARLVEPIGNTGKPTQVNRMVPMSRGDILLFNDARQPLSPGSLKALAEVLSDPRVGGGTGAVEYRPADGAPVMVGGYWRYESAIRVWESAAHSCTSGAGPLMCCRRELYRPMPEALVLDDILTPIRVVLAGKRFVYVPEAVAVETFVMDPRHEFRRRVRNSAGVIQAIRSDLRTLVPWRNPVWLQFWSHKCGRLAMPFLLAAVLLGSVLGLGLHPFFGWLLAAQAAFYAYAGLGWLTAESRWSPPGSRLALSLVMLALVVLGGFHRELRGVTTAAWGSDETRRR